jgi:hypothetical protein
MYLTAHLIRSNEGAEGINSFIHSHQGMAWPADAALLPEQNPGSIVHADVSVPPGGNRVRAYLDVLGPDDLNRVEIEGALSALRDDLTERRNPTVFRHARVTVRFGTELGLEAMRGQQLEMLEQAALALFQKARRSSPARTATKNKPSDG